MSFTLAIDTAFETCQLGLWRGHDMIAAESRQGGGRHDHILATMTDDMLRQHNVTMKDISRILVTTGPGRFTGLRVGIAFARGLALVHKTELRGVLTHEAMALDMSGHLNADVTDAAVVLTVKRGESFVYGFRPDITPITRVMDEGLVGYFPKDRKTVIAGVFMPETYQALAQANHITLLEDVREPSLSAIFTLGTDDTRLADPVIRPYYAT